MKTRTTIGGLALGTLVLSGVAACSNPPKTGVVVSREFNAAHTEYDMVCIPIITSDGRGGTTSTCAYVMQGHWVGNQWSLKIRNDDDPKHVKKGWVAVSELMFNDCNFDMRWPDCTSRVH
jgi:hypothetical protein